MKRSFLVISLGLCCIAFLLQSSCSALLGGHEVRYELTGDITAERIIYFDDAGDEVSEYGVTPPWDYTYTTNDENHGVKLGAYNFNPASYGTLSVEVFIDGESVLDSSDSSSTSIATTTGTYTLDAFID